MPERSVDTVTVLGSQVMARADGRVSIRLDLRGRNPIALELNLHDLDVLRRNLVEVETILRRSTGTTQGH